MTSQLAFYLDTNACTGCKACQVACKDRNDLQRGLLFRRVYEVVGGGWQRANGVAWQTNVVAYNLSIACNHCEDPACAHACPAMAIGKRADGIVLIDSRRCLGCRYCEWACPYGAIRFDTWTNTATKCTFCVEAIDRGEPPACVGACPQRAIEYGELAELRERHGNTDHPHPLPDPALTAPALVVTPHRRAGEPAARTGAIANWEEV
jgi:anaerobic dimethyl sulfoxide reductase subunit B (iron-sulfur subunit)